MEVSDQDSCQALIASIVPIIRGCLHIYGTFTGDRADGQSRNISPEKFFSPQFLVSNWSGICKSLKTCPLPTEFLLVLQAGKCMAGESGDQGKTETYSRRINPILSPQLLAFALIWSQWIHRELTPSKEPSPLGATICDIYIFFEHFAISLVSLYYLDLFCYLKTLKHSINISMLNFSKTRS